MFLTGGVVTLPETFRELERKPKPFHSLMMGLVSFDVHTFTRLRIFMYNKPILTQKATHRWPLSLIGRLCKRPISVADLHVVQDV